MRTNVEKLLHSDARKNYADRYLKVFRYIFGFDDQWRDARPAQLALGIVRIGLFLSIAWVNRELYQSMGEITAFAKARAEGSYTAFGLLMLFGSKPPGALFWEMTFYVSWISTFMAIIGLCTRPAMIVSTISVLLIALLEASPFYACSHGYNVNFLAAIPFMFSQAGQSMSVDKWIAKFWPNYWFAPRQAPVFWAVLSVQYSAALFYFGSFWAKFIISSGTINYIFSDNMRHILAVTWLSDYRDVVIPWQIDLIANTPWLWMATAAGHLFMQAIVIMVVVAVNRPNLRLFEGVNFSVSAIALYFVMGVFDPWWILLATAFVDWDYYAKRKATYRTSAVAEAALEKPRTAIRYLSIFFGIYIAGFMGMHADKLRIYPFSDMNMYAAVYAMKPYREHLPYVDILRGRIMVQLPDNRWKMNEAGVWVHGKTPVAEPYSAIIGKTFLGNLVMKQDGETLNFTNIAATYHWLAREEDLSKLKGSMNEFLTSLGNRQMFPKGSRLIVRRETVAFSAYPEPFGSKKIFHSGARGVMDIDTGQFVGASPELDTDTRIITINGQGVIRGTKILGSPNVRKVPVPEPYAEIEGRWLDANRFEISEEGFKKYRGGYVNLLIEADTLMGPVAFDGQLKSW